MSSRKTNQPQLPTITATVETITPTRAAELLKGNRSNRPLNQNWVKTLAGIITSGKWKLTHQGIAIATDGVVVDGQHRLSAIVAANKAVQIMVARNAPTDVFDAIDGGKKRTVADYISVLFGLGINDASISSAILHVIAAMTGNTSGKISQSELCSMFERYKSAIEWVLQYTKNHGPDGRTPTPILAGLVWAHRYYPKECEYLITKYIKPSYLHDGSPVFALQTAANRSKSSLNDRKALALKTLRVLEAVIDKESLSRCEASPTVLERLHARAGAN